VNVNIANIPTPTQEERAEMQEMDAKLDAIAARLKAQCAVKPQPAPGGLRLSAIPDSYGVSCNPGGNMRSQVELIYLLESQKRAQNKV